MPSSLAPLSFDPALALDAIRRHVVPPPFRLSRGPLAPRRGLVPHAAAPRGTRRQEVSQWGRGARHERGHDAVGREAAGFEVSMEPMPELPKSEMPDFWEGLQWEVLHFFVQSCGHSACVPPLHYPAPLAWIFRSSRSIFFSAIYHANWTRPSLHCLYVELLAYRNSN